MVEYFDQLAEANRKIFSSLDEEERRINDREAEARAIVAACASDRAVLTSKRHILTEAEKIHAEFMQSSGVSSLTQPAASALTQPKSPQVIVFHATGRKRRARIGPQRYLVLNALEVFGALDQESLTIFSDVDSKRVKDLIRSDVPEGIIREIKEGDADFNAEWESQNYALTDEGLDLIRRFRAYKEAKGEPLPSSDQANQDDASEEDDESSDVSKSFVVMNGRDVRKIIPTNQDVTTIFGEKLKHTETTEHDSGQEHSEASAEAGIMME